MVFARRHLTGGGLALWAVGAAIFVLTALALTLLHRTPPLPVPKGPAIRAALANPDLQARLGAASYDRLVVDRVDARFDRVSFYSGHKIQAEVEVEAGGRSAAAVDFRRIRVPYGNWIAYDPALLAGLAGLFVLMTAVAPWRRLRNLDVAAVLSLTAPVSLLQARYVDASVLAALPGLSYLLVRCAVHGLGAEREAPVSVPLWSLATASLAPEVRVRILRLAFAALACVVLMIGITSTDAVDVIYAVMEGATNLVHGLLPYGHMPSDVVHGDTYPILSYALYTPIALLAPVHSRWDSVDLALSFGAVAAVGAGLAIGGRALFMRGRGGAAAPSCEREPGLRAAVAWLAFPPLVVTVSTGTTDVVLGALLALAVLAWRRPTLCSAVVSCAAWFKLAPAALLVLVFAPLRGSARAGPALAVGVVSLPLIALLVAVGGPAGPADMLHAVAFQLSRGSEQSIWAATGLRSWQPLGQAAVLGLLGAAAIALRRDPGLAADRGRVAALAAAVLIGLELAADYWAFLYLVWVVPLIMLSVLSPARTAPVGISAPSPSAGVLPDGALA
jgi:hypothetical protein